MTEDRVSEGGKGCLIGGGVKCKARGRYREGGRRDAIVSEVWSVIGWGLQERERVSEVLLKIGECDVSIAGL